MGYVLSAYIVDQDELAAAIGSGDKSLVARVVRSNRGEFDDEDDFPPGSVRPSLREALQRLVDGRADLSDDPQYRYAFEELCRFAGKVSFADRFDPDALGLRNLFDRPLPFAVPNPGDFPRLAYLPADSVEGELSRVQSLELSDGDEPTHEMATAWLRCLKSAKRKRCGVAIVYG